MTKEANVESLVQTSKVFISNYDRSGFGTWKVIKHVINHFKFINVFGIL